MAVSPWKPRALPPPVSGSAVSPLQFGSSSWSRPVRDSSSSAVGSRAPETRRGNDPAHPSPPQAPHPPQEQDTNTKQQSMPARGATGVGARQLGRAAWQSWCPAVLRARGCSPSLFGGERVCLAIGAGSSLWGGVCRNTAEASAGLAHRRTGRVAQHPHLGGIQSQPGRCRRGTVTEAE